MADTKFDSKSFNPEALGKYVDRIPNVKKNELAKSGAVGSNASARAALSNQTGSLYARIPYFGRISGETSQNNNGETDITSTSTTTYEQGFVTASRMDSWTEKSFSRSITAGVNFMDNVAAQIADYKFEVKQAMLLKILEGIFGMTTTGSTVRAKAAKEFVEKHTFDITANKGEAAMVGATTLNKAMQQACGDNKDIFKLVIMHSEVATNLENLQVLEYLKQTDANGIQRYTGLATWNGRTVLIDDEVPTEEVPESGQDPNKVPAYTKYTTYILGQNAFDYCDCGAAVPNETYRDPKSAGGKEWLITRQRKIFAPKGFSFVQPSAAIVSPTNEQLATAARWTVIKDSAGTGFFDNKAIPFARIISKG